LENSISPTKDFEPDFVNFDKPVSRFFTLQPQNPSNVSEFQQAVKFTQNLRCSIFSSLHKIGLTNPELR